MSLNPEAMDEGAGMRFSSRPAPWQLAGSWWMCLLGAFGDFVIASAKSSLPVRRRLSGYALTVVLAPLVTLLLVGLRGKLNLTTDVLAFLVAVIAVAMVGGFVPAVLEAIAGSLLLNFYFTPPVHKFTIAEASNAAALTVYVVVALVVSFLVDDAARRTKQAARATAEAELLVNAAGCVLHGQEALAAVLDRAREAFGMQSVTLLERGRGVSGTLGEPAVGWTPVAVSGGPPPGKPDDAAVEVPATDTLRLMLRGRPLPTTDHRSLGAFAAFAATALAQERLTAAAEAARPIVEADRMRAALLATVSHDLRTPLAAAKAAVSGLRSQDVQLTAEDHDELLAAADESLDRLTHLVACLLDMSRLQAGALSMFPSATGLKDVISRSLTTLGSRRARLW
jgi:two-component system, OmpR family, sensor histidine kinase KdpD